MKVRILKTDRARAVQGGTGTDNADANFRLPFEFPKSKALPHSYLDILPNVCPKMMPLPVSPGRVYGNMHLKCSVHQINNQLDDCLDASCKTWKIDYAGCILRVHLGRFSMSGMGFCRLRVRSEVSKLSVLTLKHRNKRLLYRCLPPTCCHFPKLLR